MLLMWIQALVVNAVLIGLAQRTPLLTTRGWIHAAALGTMLWGSLGWRGWSAVVVYLVLGSVVTRIGFRNKQVVDSLKPVRDEGALKMSGVQQLSVPV